MFPSNKPSKVDKDVDITAENQKKINQFAVKNGWVDELEEDIKGRRTLLKALEDALEEIPLLDEVAMGIGSEAFVVFGGVDCGGSGSGVEAAEEHLKNRIENLKKSIAVLEGKLSGVRAEMAKLKEELYAQFGDSINLEVE